MPPAADPRTVSRRNSNAGPKIVLVHPELARYAYRRGREHEVALGVVEDTLQFLLYLFHAGDLVDEVHVPGRTPELAVGDRVQPDILLELDDVADGVVFACPQLVFRDGAASCVFPGLQQAFRPEQAADVVRPERWLVTSRQGIPPRRSDTCAIAGTIGKTGTTEPTGAFEAARAECRQHVERVAGDSRRFRQRLRTACRTTSFGTSAHKLYAIVHDPMGLTLGRRGSRGAVTLPLGARCRAGCAGSVGNLGGFGSVALPECRRLAGVQRAAVLACRRIGVSACRRIGVWAGWWMNLGPRRV